LNLVKICQDGNQMIAISDGPDSTKQVVGSIMGVIRKDEDK
jgi:hypothetical protein